MVFAGVHSPLVGPITWSLVAEELVRRGHTAVAPSMLAATAEGPPFWERQAEAVAVAVAEAAPGETVVLAGHSGAGPLLPAVGAALAQPVAEYLFVDAHLPIGGQSRLETLHPSFRGRLRALAQDGVLPPWTQWWRRGALHVAVPDDALRARLEGELPSVPLALLEEPLPEVAGWPDAPCGYLRLSRGYDATEAEAARMGWPVSRIDGRHLEPILRPAAVAEAIVALVERMEAGR